jgi:hypothetical protein
LPYDARKVSSSLQRKGFSLRQNDHTFFQLIVDGKDAGVFTKISHGEREIGMPLAKRMQHQMKLPTSSDFRDFVECPMSADEYLALLREGGHL